MKIKINNPDDYKTFGDFEYKVDIDCGTGLELLLFQAEGMRQTAKIIDVENVNIIGSIGFEEVGLYFNGGGNEAHIHLSLDDAKKISVGIQKIIEKTQI